MEYFLVGIMGSGMRALANLLLKMGHKISGSDVKKSFYIKDKLDSKIKLYELKKTPIDNKYIYILGNSFTSGYIASKLKKNNINFYLYPVFIEQLDFITKIAVCGSHGKTTTVKMVEEMAVMTSLVGDGSANFQNEREFVYEACEYKDTFLHYFPDILITLNVDYDHTDYFKDETAYKKSFLKFYTQAKVNIFNYDDSFLKENYEGYSFSLFDDKAYLYASIIKKAKGYLVDVKKPFRKTFQTAFYSVGDIYSFLSILVLYSLLNKNIDELKNRINLFKMPDRRFNLTSVFDKHIVLDYAHHPSQITSLYDRLSYQFKDYKKYIIYEGHTLKRSLDFLDEFKNSLSLFDEVFLFKLFSSNRERNSFKTRKYYRLMSYKRYNKNVINKLKKETNFVLVLAGAGNIDKLYPKLIAKLKNK